MKLIFSLTVLMLSSLSFAKNYDCSPYVTETTTIIEQGGNCDAGAKLAKQCAMGSRNDAFLAYSAINVCKDSFGGEAGLTSIELKKYKAGNKACSESNPDNLKALFCMLDVAQAMSHHIIK